MFSKLDERGIPSLPRRGAAVSCWHCSLLLPSTKTPPPSTAAYWSINAIALHCVTAHYINLVWSSANTSFLYDAFQLCKGK